MLTQKQISALKTEIIDEIDGEIDHLHREIARLETEKMRRLKGLEVALGEKSSKKHSKMAKNNEENTLDANHVIPTTLKMRPKRGQIISKIKEFIADRTSSFTTREVINFLENEGFHPIQSSISTTLIRLAEERLIHEIDRKGRAAIYEKFK